MSHATGACAHARTLLSYWEGVLKFATRNNEIGIQKQHDGTYTSVGPIGPSSTYTSVGPQVLAAPTLLWAKFGAMSILIIP